LITVPLARPAETLGDGTPSRRGELAHGDLDADSGEKADEDRPGDEVGEEAESRETGKEEQSGGDQRADAREGEPLARARLQTGDAQRRDSRVEDGRRGGVAADDEMA
jgi:hypothetical protein